jgi:hypothetical protein
MASIVDMIDAFGAEPSGTCYCTFTILAWAEAAELGTTSRPGRVSAHWESNGCSTLRSDTGWSSRWGW